jgi:SAM-dependent methyltransferase
MSEEYSTWNRVVSGPYRSAARLIKRIFPGQFDSKWRDERDYITFQPGGFASGTNDRATFSARIFFEVNTLEKMLDTHDIKPSRSLEVGCGYGRMSPWLARRSDRHVALDPNAEALCHAWSLHPEVRFVRASATDVPFPAGMFDFALTWTVLQHLPPEAAEHAAASLSNCLADGGLLLVCEKVRGDDYEHVWVRSQKEYENLFETLELIDSSPRRLEPTYESLNGELLLFQA